MRGIGSGGRLVSRVEFRGERRRREGKRCLVIFTSYDISS